MFIFEKIQDYAYPIKFEIVSFLSNWTWGVNVFWDSYLFAFTSALIALLIVVLYSNAIFSTLKNEEASWKTLLLKALATIAIITLFFSEYITSVKPEIIQGNTYTYDYLILTSDKESVKEDRIIPEKDILDWGYIFESMNQSSLVWMDSHYNKGWIKTIKWVYIKPDDLYKKAEIVLPENKKIITDILWFTPKETLMIPDASFSQGVSYYYNELSVNPALVANSYFSNDKIPFSAFRRDWFSAKNIPATQFTLIDDTDYWVWKVVKVVKTSGRMDISLYVIPNLYTYQFEQTFTKWISQSESGAQAPYKDYKKEKENQCIDSTDCNYSDIIERKLKDYQNMNISPFLSYISIVQKWLNFQSSDAGVISPMSVNLIWSESGDLKTAFWFFNELKNRGWTTLSFKNYTGLNYINNNKSFAYYISDDTNWEDLKIRETYSLGLFKEDSVYKKFYSTLVWIDNIWFLETFFLFLLYLFWFPIKILWTFYIIKVVRDILE